MLCRLCLFELITEDDAFDFTDDNGNRADQAKLNKIISKNFDLQNSEVVDISTKICNHCLTQLDSFCTFLLFVEKRQEEFLKRINNCNFKVEKIEFSEPTVVTDSKSNRLQLSDVSGYSAEQQLLLGNNIETLLDIKDVLLTSNNLDLTGEFLSTTNEENSKDDTAENLIDVFNSNEAAENNSIDDDDFDGDDDIPLKNFISESNLCEIKSEKNIVKLYLKQAKKKSVGSSKKQLAKSKRSKKLRSEKSSTDIGEHQQKIRKTYVDYDHEKAEAFISKHLRLKCEVCEEPMETFVKLKKHCSQVHNSRGFVMCCGRRFFRRFVLTDHIHLHLDPNFFKCNECGKVLKSKNCLEIHIKNKHVNKEELKFVCECGRRFAHSNNLRAHQLTHVLHKKFTCEFCKKGFKTSYSLQVHIKAIHREFKAFVCDICGKEFKFKPSFLRHIAEHAGTYKAEPTEQCLICGKWYMKNGLKKHLDTHNNEEVDCSECGKTLRSKSALNSHIKYTHIERPLHKCTFCEKTFKQRTNLKEHMAIHTGTKDHRCPHCPREFRSKANMYVHIKRIHVKEWTQAQLARTKAPSDHRAEMIGEQAIIGS